MKKKIIILGSDGFIGGWLLKRFSENSLHEVQGYSAQDCNLLSEISIAKTLARLKKEDIVIMTSSITRLIENSYESMKKNIHMAENISEFIKRHPINYFIFLSTVDIYGLLDDNVVINENLLPNPFDYYAISKLSSEFILKKSFSENKIPLLILRLSGIYGPGDHEKSTINKLVESAVKYKKIIIWGKGDNKRDFVYVDDIYRLINQALEKKIDLVLNIATGKSYSIRQIAEIIRKCCNKKIRVDYKIQRKSNEKRIENMVYDISLLHKTFPNIRFTDLQEGISLYLKEFLERKN